MKNKSVYLIYDTVNCTPNGDPDNNGEQRYNETSNRACVTDLRIKRFGRDKLKDVGVPIFYFYDKETIVVGDKKLSGAAARFKLFCDEKGIVSKVAKPKKKKNKEDDVEVSSDDSTIAAKVSSINAEKILLENFVDVRIFGCILTQTENNARVTGALQFDAENNSVNEVLFGKNLMNRGITTVFPTDDGKSQGSMGRDSYLRYGLFCIKGRVSANTAKYNSATDDDLKLILSAIWDGMKSINTRSKFGHEPIACIVVEHPTKEVKNGFLGAMFSKSFQPFTIKTSNKLSDIYHREDYEFDFTPLRDKLNSREVENVIIYCDDEKFVEKHFSNLPKNCEVLNPLDVLFSLI